MQSYTQEDIVELIKSHGLKYTEHRYAVLYRVAKSKTPISVQKIIEDLQKKYHIDPATIYRNLNSLQDVELIRKYDYGGVAHYELGIEDETHKLICNSCKSVEKVSSLVFDEPLKKIIRKSKKFNNSINAIVTVYAYCKNCVK